MAEKKEKGIDKTTDPVEKRKTPGESSKHSPERSKCFKQTPGPLENTETTYEKTKGHQRKNGALEKPEERYNISTGAPVVNTWPRK